MNNEMLRELTKIATRSTNDKYLTGCIILDRKENIISNGWSHTGNWRSYGDERLRLYTTHAEIHALARARHEDTEGGICVVLNFSRRSGNITSGKPCFTCATALIAAGIDTAIYSEKSGSTIPIFEWTRMYLPDCLQDLKVYNKTDA